MVIVCVSDKLSVNVNIIVESEVKSCGLVPPQKASISSAAASILATPSNGMSALPPPIVTGKQLY